MAKLLIIFLLLTGPDYASGNADRLIAFSALSSEGGGGALRWPRHNATLFTRNWDRSINQRVRTLWLSDVRYSPDLTRKLQGE